MKLFPGLRHGTLLCLAAIVLTAIADAQPPGGGRGGRGGQQGQGGGQQGRRGGFGGGRGGFGGAQRGPGGGPGFAINRATLLGSSQVREELKIDAGQGATLDAAIESYRDEQREGGRIDFQALRDMDEAERNEVLEKARKDREALSKKTDEILAALLEPGQVERLDQIALQIQLQGDIAAALQGDDLKQKLGVTEEQVASLKAVQEETAERQQEMRDRMRESFRNGGGGGGRGDFEAMRAEGEKMRTAATEKAMAVLTAEQTKKLNGMKGTPFELDMRQLFGGRGRGGFGGGPPGGGRGGRGEGGGRGGRGRGGDRPPIDDPASI